MDSKFICFGCRNPLEHYSSNDVITIHRCEICINRNQLECFEQGRFHERRELTKFLKLFLDQHDDWGDKLKGLIDTSPSRCVDAHVPIKNFLPAWAYSVIPSSLNPEPKEIIELENKMYEEIYGKPKTQTKEDC